MGDPHLSNERLEQSRADQLREAQTKAENLFHQIDARGLVRPGITESHLNEDIYALAKQMYGIDTYWHKRIVRAGRNTLLPYAENPPDLPIGADDILFLDLGPVFEKWEADFGRTYVLGSDPVKHKLREDVGQAFADGKRYFEGNANITASELYRYAQHLAGQFGWEFGGLIAGHLIGEFPHERIPEDKVTLYVHPDSHLPMRQLDEKGQQRHWILEIHFVDRKRQIGAFYEELLTVGPPCEQARPPVTD
jgi:Xaa-Pro dipeptidase